MLDHRVEVQDHPAWRVELLEVAPLGHEEVYFVKANRVKVLEVLNLKFI